MQLQIKFANFLFLKFLPPQQLQQFVLQPEHKFVEDGEEFYYRESLPISILASKMDATDNKIAIYKKNHIENF